MHPCGIEPPLQNHYCRAHLRGRRIRVYRKLDIVKLCVSMFKDFCNLLNGFCRERYSSFSIIVAHVIIQNFFWNFAYWRFFNYRIRCFPCDLSHKFPFKIKMPANTISRIYWLLRQCVLALNYLHLIFLPEKKFLNGLFPISFACSSLSHGTIIL